MQLRLITLGQRQAQRFMVFSHGDLLDYRIDLFLLPLHRDQMIQPLAEGLTGGVAQNILGRGIPTGHHTHGVHTHNGIG